MRPCKRERRNAATAELADKLMAGSRKPRLQAVPAGNNPAGGETPPPARDERPTLVSKDGELHRIVDEIDQHVGRNPEIGIFRMGTSLVAPVDAARNPHVKRTAGATTVVPLTVPALQDRLTRAFRFLKWDRRISEYRDIDCPALVARAFLERRDYRYTRELSAIAESPVLLRSGNLLRTQGFDQNSGIFIARAPRGGFTVDPPDRARAEEGLAGIKAILEEFPFVDQSDLAGAIAAMLTPLVAPGLRAVPAHVATADAAGSGKSTLWDVAALIATGRPCPVLTWPRDEAEAEKRLHGVVLSRDPIINLDNIEAPAAFAGETLCTVTTQDQISIRPLGGSNVIKVPARLAIFSTGNGILVKGDMVRRVVFVRLSAGMEDPSSRSFNRNILDYVTENRERLIRDLLSIPLGYMAERGPSIPGLRPFGSFEDWDYLVRRPLVWLGMPDPLGPAQTLRVDDPDRQAHIALLRAWRGQFASSPVSAAEVIRAATGTARRMDGVLADEAPELADAVEAVCGAKRMDARNLGYALRRYRNRIHSGLRLEQDEGNRTGTARWRVVEL